MDLNNKVGVITGAAQGLGKAFAEALLSKGAKVSISDVNVEVGRKTASEFEKKYGKEKVLFMKCDVTSSEEFEDVFKKTKTKYGNIDIVINNAGIVNEKHWKKAIQINLMGSIEGTLLAIQYMSRSTGGQGGVIINIASAAGLQPVFTMPTYSASKHGTVGYTTSWAQNPENTTNGLRFNCICPTFVDTNIIKITDDNTLSKQASEQLLQHYGVMGVEKVVEGVMEVITDKSKNGAVLKITSQNGLEYLNQ
ncbi:hypothetical protein LOTGIDRAFT_204498 [Lottia gigantea]|uniref:15-hydroxyprostaglandin dehydrogenase [NAD(+)] n=1 Tax=Lottia gigantea TaxID=225164 RepID=V3Z807_LOTGI|nr:hypothetical protein LOTGIDRAFT_204498 [Lottia gigantea]ESO86973.1 hypothetical protein LOTGIDRAFT_204498 [Lottia gigantea]